MKWPLTLIDGTPSILSKTTYCWLIWTKSQVYLNSGAADKDSRRFSTFHHHFLETKSPALLPLEPWVTPQKKVAWLRTVGEIPMNFSPKKYGRFLKWTYPQLSSIYRWIFIIYQPFLGSPHFRKPPYPKMIVTRVVSHLRLHQWWNGWIGHGRLHLAKPNKGRDEGRRWLVLQIPLNNYNSTRIIIRARLATLGGN